MEQMRYLKCDLFVCSTYIYIVFTVFILLGYQMCQKRRIERGEIKENVILLWTECFSSSKIHILKP